jgi:hypothetical protein
MGSGHAPQVVQFLKLHEIVALSMASTCLASFCRAPLSRKLLVPVFYREKRHAPHVEPTSIQVMYADHQVLTSFDRQEEFFRWQAECTDLRCLYCAQCENMLGAQLAKSLATMSRLAVLDLAHNHLAVDARGSFKRDQPLQPLFDALPPRLRTLDLSHNLLRDEHAKQLVSALIEKAGDTWHLEHLMLRSNYIGDEGAFALGEFMQLEASAGLLRLDLRTNQVDAQGACALLGALRVHPRMQEIRLGYNRHNTKQELETCDLACLLLQKAIATTSQARLQVLDLNNVRVADLGALRISQALRGNALLRQLYMTFNSIGKDGAGAFADALVTNRCLEILDVRDNEVGDDGAEALAKGLHDNFTMRKLLIARNEVGRRGAKALGHAVQQNPTLTVDFGASGAGTSGLQEMVRLTPRYGVDWWS